MARTSGSKLSIDSFLLVPSIGSVWCKPKYGQFRTAKLWGGVLVGLCTSPTLLKDTRKILTMLKCSVSVNKMWGCSSHKNNAGHINSDGQPRYTFRQIHQSSARRPLLHSLPETLHRCRTKTQHLSNDIFTAVKKQQIYFTLPHWSPWMLSFSRFNALRRYGKKTTSVDLQGSWFVNTHKIWNVHTGYDTGSFVLVVSVPRYVSLKAFRSSDICRFSWNCPSHITFVTKLQICHKELCIMGCSWSLFLWQWHFSNCGGARSTLHIKGRKLDLHLMKVMFWSWA